MRGWVQTVAVCVWAGFAPVTVQISQAGQLPEDLHPVSRSRLPPIDREELDPARRETYDAVMRATGSGGAPTSAGALRLHGSGTDLRFSGPLGRRLTELAILTTAREHDQPYEWALHELDALAVGLDELLIDVVRHRKPISGVGDPEAIIMEVGRELFTTRRLGSDTYARAGAARQDQPRRPHRSDGPLRVDRRDADRGQSADADGLAAVPPAALHLCR